MQRGTHEGALRDRNESLGANESGKEGATKERAQCSRARRLAQLEKFTRWPRRRRKWQFL